MRKLCLKLHISEWMSSNVLDLLKLVLDRDVILNRYLWQYLPVETILSWNSILVIYLDTSYEQFNFLIHQLLGFNFVTNSKRGKRDHGRKLNLNVSFKSFNCLKTVKRSVRKSPSGALKYVKGKNNRWSNVDVTNCNMDPAHKRGPMGL